MPRRDFIAIEAMMRYEPAHTMTAVRMASLLSVVPAAFIVPTQQIKPAYSEPAPTLHNLRQLVSPPVGYLHM